MNLSCAYISYPGNHAWSGVPRVEYIGPEPYLGEQLTWLPGR